MNTGHKIHIKNMVCPRCIATVKDVFQELSIDYSSIRLGEVVTDTTISDDMRETLGKTLKLHGFELLEDHKSKIVSQIKTIIIRQIHNTPARMDVNFSTMLAEELHQEYSSLSRIFSQSEGMTIERYIVRQKMERVKELLFYGELNLTEIAYKMDYSSVAHLSAQFKKETGMTPTGFKKTGKPGHHSRDNV
jgi:AraC-like DNA-binding protein